MTTILDGSRLAGERLPALRSRAARVSTARGHAPRLALIAFADDDGRARYCERKRRACGEAGVDAGPVVLPATATTAAVRRAIARATDLEAADAVFLEFPFPPGVDADEVASAIPDPFDVDVMGDSAVSRFFADPAVEPPLTVSAGLALLDRFEVEVAGLPGIIVGEPSPFVSMFIEALARRGASLATIVSPVAPELKSLARDASLFVSAAARPHLIRSGDLAPGAVVIDAGYFNPGGQGDIDTTDGSSTWRPSHRCRAASGR